MSSKVEAFVKLQELRQENARLRRIQELKEKYGVYFYRPHLKQHKFHTAKAIGRYLRTGNRFGKSESGICEDIAWCMGGRVWYKDAFDIYDGERNVAVRHEGGADHPFIRAGIPNRPVKGLLIVADWGVSQRIFTNRDGSHEQLGKLFRFLPALSIGRITTTQGGYVEQVEILRPDEFGGGSSTLTIDTIEAYKRNKLSADQGGLGKGDFLILW